MGATRKFIDLHTHSAASDGSLRPAELIRLAEDAHLTALALTDHDTMDGLAEARAAAAGLPHLHFIGGIEVSAQHSGGVMHILGLGLDESCPAIQALARDLRSARDDRNPRIIKRLQTMGMDLDMGDIAAVAAATGGTQRRPTVLGRLHIAQVLVSKGYAASIEEAFDRFVGEGRPAFVAKDKLPPAKVIGRLKEASAAAVLAHPVQLQCPNLGELETLSRRLMRAGLDGIEVYHSDHDGPSTRQYLDLARHLGLLITGGSDFHGVGKPHVRLGRPRVPISLIDEPWRSRWFGAPPGSGSREAGVD